MRGGGSTKRTDSTVSRRLSGRESSGRFRPPSSVVTVVTRLSSLTTKRRPNVFSNCDFGPAMPKLEPSGAWTSKPAEVKCPFAGVILARSLAGTASVTTAETHGSCIMIEALSDRLLDLAGLDARGADRHPARRAV